MERQLIANDHKPGWESEEYGFLFEAAKEQMTDLWVMLSEHKLGEDTVLLQNKCANVANFAMMISDNLSEEVKK